MQTAVNHAKLELCLRNCRQDEIIITNVSYSMPELSDKTSIPVFNCLNQWSVFGHGDLDPTNLNFKLSHTSSHQCTKNCLNLHNHFCEFGYGDLNPIIKILQLHT